MPIKDEVKIVEDIIGILLHFVLVPLHFEKVKMIILNGTSWQNDFGGNVHKWVRILYNDTKVV